MDWVKENLDLPANTVYVTHNTGSDSWQDMMLMSHCRHNVICNSTFSWWGAWLNPNKDKLVTAPEPWFGDRECRDIYTEGMIRISPDGGIRHKERISEE